MDTPGEGEGSSSDDGLIAKVIPLRRREAGDAWERSLDPSPCDIFEPPQDPDPLGEYSVWETPTAELVRREPPRHRAWGLGYWSRFRREPGRQRWLALAALGLVGLAVAVLSALPLGRNGHAPVTIGRVSPSVGLGQTLGGISAPRPSSRASDTRHRPNNRIAAATSGRQEARVARPAAPHRPAPAVDSAVSVAYSSHSATPTPSTSPSASTTATPAVATAAREFGFEH
jgi:hypothetical protein